MSGYFLDREYLSCEGCGMSLSPGESRAHICDAERRARFEAFQARNELAELDRQLDAFFESPAGRFAVYYAERDRRRRAA
jgi:hypothetical protein